MARYGAITVHYHMTVHGSRTERSLGSAKTHSLSALLASVSIHGAIVAVVVLAAYGRSSSETRGSPPAPGIIGSADSGSGGGVSATIAAPPAGPSLNPLDGVRYVGHYQREMEFRGRTVLQVVLVNDGESEPHWALTISEGPGPVHKLTLVARDTFAFQLAPKQRVIFRRQNDSVTALSVRRSRDTSWAERVASRP